MAIKPNYINPTVAERSFRELVPELTRLGIDRKKFMSMLRDLSYYVTRDMIGVNNLFECTTLVDSYRPVRVVKQAVRNPLTREQYATRGIKHKYIEAYDAVIIPLVPHITHHIARLAIAPDAGLMEIQVKIVGTRNWICMPTNGRMFKHHFDLFINGW